MVKHPDLQVYHYDALLPASKRLLAEAADASRHDL
jgi:hypothetical protein